MTPLLVGLLLDVVKAGDELAVGALQGIVGTHAVEASRIDEREEQVTELLLTIHIAVASQLGFNLAELLTHLVPDVLALLPVKAHVGGLLLNALGLDERRQAARHPAEHHLVTTLLAHLDQFPVLEHLGGGVGLLLAEDVRMAVNQLVAQGIAHVGDVKFALLVTDFGIKDDVQQHVAQFFAYGIVILVHDGVGEFHGLLDGVGTQALVGLLAVPRALHAQLVKDVEQASESLQFLLSAVVRHD